MLKPCTKCKKSPNIRINMLNYCNGCFEAQLLVKAYKNLSGIVPNTKVLVYLAEDSASVALCSILDRFFRVRSHYHVTFFCKNRKPLEDRILKLCEEGPGDPGDSDGLYPTVSILSDADLGLPEASGGTKTSPGQIKKIEEGVLDYCEKNGVRTIIYQETLEKTLAGSLEMLCHGLGEAAALNTSPGWMGGTRTINAFGNIKNKSIVYYIYIKNIERLGESQPKDRVKKVLNDFLCETDGKNSLALFNIANTLRKLHEK